MKISTCLIVKNEADNIARCLDSVKTISDEIIVVDTGSTDNTVEIARSFGARVYFYEWDNNFSNAKNFALDKATGDWIIFLDADEYFDSDTPKNLLQMLKRINNDKDHDAVLFKMCHTEGYNGRIISVTPTVRAFRGLNKIRFFGSVHEQPLNKDNTLYAANMTDYDSLVVYHTGYSSVLLPEKVNRNLEILKNEIVNNNITHFTYYYMSSLYNNLNNPEECIKYALLALKEPGFEKTILAYQPYVFIIDNMLKLKTKYKFEEIEKYINEAIGRFPTHPEIWYVTGNVRKEQGDYTDAIESYQKALECNRNFKLFLHNNFPARLYLVNFYLAELLKKTGQPVQALDYYVESLRINKYNFDAVKGLYDIIKNQNPAEIVLFLNSIFNKDNKEDLAFLVLAMDKLDSKKIAAYYYSLHESK
ncbi:MAG: glycosyltransferase [Clostridiaceae bacterium]|nr:glycosyltransferase [Clostridiaceae bacterium]